MRTGPKEKSSSHSGADFDFGDFDVIESVEVVCQFVLPQLSIVRPWSGD
jgi:hypothetical protein